MLLQALGATPAPPTGGGGGAAVEVCCHIGKMFVRVKKAIFNVKKPIQNLKLGACTVNKILHEHYYFLLSSDGQLRIPKDSSEGIFMVIFRYLDVLQQTVFFRAL